MPSYFIGGASRGIGYAMVKALSADKNNTVFAFVRTLPAAEAKFTAEFPDRKNVHFIQGDLTKLATIKDAVKKVSAVTGGSLDVLIANAAILQPTHVPISVHATATADEFDQEMFDDFRTNVLGATHLMAEFAPLLEAGKLKKAVAISSAMGDIDFVRENKVFLQSPYGISKAALNMAVANFDAEYRDKGILFMAVSPGVVDTGGGATDEIKASPEKMAALMEGFQILGKIIGGYDPNFKGPIQPDESARLVLKVIEEATIEKNAGKMVSHFGNTKWV